MKVPSLKLVVLKSNNVESLYSFYSGLGFRFKEEQHGSGPRHYSAQLGEGILEIYPLPAGASVDVTTRFGFGVVDVVSVVEEVATVADLISKPKKTKWGLRAVVRDPDGRTVELYESAPTEGDANA